MPPRAKASAKQRVAATATTATTATATTDAAANMHDLIDDVINGVGDADNVCDVDNTDTTNNDNPKDEDNQDDTARDDGQNAIDEQNEKDKQPVKKRPGRPKKRVVTEAIKISGVVDAPNDPEDKVEMVYQNPTLFKSIFALLKAYAAKELMMHFKAETIDIAAHDHLDSTSILATIDCSKLVHYYCGEETKVFIKRTEIETILKNLRKVHKRLTFILKTNYTSHIVIQTENSEMDNRNVYEVELCQINERINDVFYNENDYPLNFTLPAKHFKEEINSISQLSTRFSVEKNYGEPLSFSFENHKTKTIMNSPYLNPKKIKLYSSVHDDDIFAVSIKIDYIKPFANTKLGDDVELYVACDKKIMFKTQLDGEVCTVRVYTDIIKINPDDL